MYRVYFNAENTESHGKRMPLWVCAFVLLVLCFIFPREARADVVLPVTGMTVSDSYASGPYYQKLIDAIMGSEGLSPVERFIKIAESQKGYTGSTVADFSGNGDGGEYTEYNKHNTPNYPSTDWCANYVAWCADAAGFSKSVMPRGSYARNYTLSSVGTFYRMWSDDFTTVKTDFEPKRGDLLLFMPKHDVDRNLETGDKLTPNVTGCKNYFNSWKVAAHVAIVTDAIEIDRSKGKWEIKTIERKGNTVWNDSYVTTDDKTASRTCSATTCSRTGGYNSGSECAHLIQGFFRPDWSKASVWTAADLPSRDPVNYGDSFYARILFKHPARLAVVNSANDNVEIGDELRRAVEDWHFERQSDGSYIIESVYNGKVLDVDGANPANATNVQVYQRWGEDNTAQKWFIYPCSDGYRLTPKLSPNRSLDASGGDFATGRNIHIYDSNTTDAQVLWICPVEYPILTSVSVNKKLSMNSSDKYDMQVSYAPDGVWMSCIGMYFSSSDPEVATVSAGGMIHALKPGTATIRATSAYSDLIYDECKVTVSLPFSADQPTMPKSLKAVADEAFMGTTLWKVVLPSGCTKIGNRAFAVSDIRYIFIPDSVTSFGDDVFTDSRTDLTIFCYSGSAAETYATQNSINCYILSR